MQLSSHWPCINHGNYGHIPNMASMAKAAIVPIDDVRPSIWVSTEAFGPQIDFKGEQVKTHAE